MRRARGVFPWQSMQEIQGEERCNMPAKLMEQIVRLRTAPSRSAVGGAADRRRNCVGAVTTSARIRRGGALGGAWLSAGGAERLGEGVEIGGSDVGDRPVV